MRCGGHGGTTLHRTGQGSGAHQRPGHFSQLPTDPSCPEDAGLSLGMSGVTHLKWVSRSPLEGPGPARQSERSPLPPKPEGSSRKAAPPAWRREKGWRRLCRASLRSARGQEWLPQSKALAQARRPGGDRGDATRRSPATILPAALLSEGPQFPLLSLHLGI